MKMRRTLAAMMSGILAMSPAGVIFADEAAQTPVTYGDMISFSLTQDGETLSADITAVYNESGDSSFSVSVTLPASMMGTEEPVVYGFDDVLRVCGEDVYLNVEEIVNIYSELTADDSMTELLSMVGITESWIEIPAPTASDDGQLDTILTAITDNLADLETVEKRIDRASKLIKGDKKYQLEFDTWKKVRDALQNGKPARSLEYTDEELEIVRDGFLLTMKPILYVANVSEDQLLDENDANVNSVKEYAKQDKAEVIKLCVKIEEELSSLDGNDKKEMLEALGLEESGLDKVIKASYDLLGLMSFLTAGEPEVRAWTIKKGTKAPQAAGKIHSDIERGFIKAEVVSYKDLMECGSMNAAKEKGLVRMEGKDYIMQDGDIVLFRFNV